MFVSPLRLCSASFSWQGESTLSEERFQGESAKKNCIWRVELSCKVTWKWQKTLYQAYYPKPVGVVRILFITSLSVILSAPGGSCWQANHIQHCPKYLLPPGSRVTHNRLSSAYIMKKKISFISVMQKPNWNNSWWQCEDKHTRTHTDSPALTFADTHIYAHIHTPTEQKQLKQRFVVLVALKSMLWHWSRALILTITLRPLCCLNSNGYSLAMC